MLEVREAIQDPYERYAYSGEVGVHITRRDTPPPPGRDTTPPPGRDPPPPPKLPPTTLSHSAGRPELETGWRGKGG